MYHLRSGAEIRLSTDGLLIPHSSAFGVPTGGTYGGGGCVGVGSTYGGTEGVGSGKEGVGGGFPPPPPEVTSLIGQQISGAVQGNLKCETFFFTNE